MVWAMSLGMCFPASLGENKRKMATLKIHTGEGLKEIPFASPVPLTELLDRAGFIMDFPCGRKGRCGRCAVEIRGNISTPDSTEIRAGSRLACRIVLFGDAEMILPLRSATLAVGSGEKDGERIPDTSTLRDLQGPGTPHDPQETVIAVADAGTTTVVMDFFSSGSGEKLGSISADNPQQSISSDVIGRIGAALEGKADLLQNLILTCLRNMAETGGYLYRIQEWIITGNTVMLTLLSGEDPSPLSRAPFRAKRLFGETTELYGRPAYLPPCVHAFFGADAVCSILSSGMAESGKTTLLCDIGTNGEMILWKKGRGWASSVSAGPALEGAGIRQGCRGIPGAIDRVTAMGGQIMAGTILHQKAVGICGSGILDAVACGTDLGLITPDGAMEKPLELRDGIRLYPEDVRAVQLAKAALRAGMETLLHFSGTDLEEVEEVVICGGFGSRLNLLSAQRIGLLPGTWLKKCRCMGNAALSGAGFMINPAYRKRAAELCEKINYISLADEDYFHWSYIRHMQLGRAEY